MEHTTQDQELEGIGKEELFFTRNKPLTGLGWGVREKNKRKTQGDEMQTSIRGVNDMQQLNAQRVKRQ